MSRIAKEVRISVDQQLRSLLQAVSSRYPGLPTNKLVKMLLLKHLRECEKLGP